MHADEPDADAQLRTTCAADEGSEPRLQLERGVAYAQMRGMIESSLFGEPPAPVRIGRFTVLEQVGAGGMGVVYAAYDDTLDRKVAVKVLRGSASAEAQERMLREARAMARLSHPNIVTVHEVAEHEGQVFLAMEFVRGRSLDRWIHEGEQPKPWREVLQVFARAGEGLAAAHDAGLVHRDFKPHNVVLGDDGTVKVLDFGLAFPTGKASTEAGSPADVESSADASLTRTGAIVGTPAYMSPEQLRAEPVTAASDQFAFCVSLFEALHGQRPFAGERLEQLILAVLDADIREPPAGASVPAWVRAIVRRGLSSKPGDRFESLRALLEALGRDPAAARRRWLLGAGVVALAVSSSVGLAALQREVPAAPCEGLAAVLDETWGPGEHDEIRRGFLASGVPYAADTWARLEPRLDAYAEAWVEASTDACRAHEAGRQSEAIFDLRAVCLESRRSALDAAVRLLGEADASVAEYAAQVVARLPPLERCGDLEALTATVPPPEDPAQAEAVAQVREQLAGARVQEEAGRYARAMALAADARERADALDYPPLRAEAALRLGSARMGVTEPSQADAALSEAVFVAIGAGHHEVAIEALSRRLFVRGELMRQPKRGVEDEPWVRALFVRDHADAHLRWLFANNLGAVHERAHDTARAVALYEEALSHARARGEEGRLDASVVLANMSLMALERDDIHEVEAKGREALSLAEGVLGPQHPQISFYLYPLAYAAMTRGRVAQAQARLERSLAIYEQADPVAPDVAQDLHLMAELAQLGRDYAGARRLAERGEEAVRSQLGPDDLLMVRVLHSMGNARVGQGAIDEGLSHHRRALALAVELLGADDFDVAASHEALGEALMGVGQLAEATIELEHALRIAEATLPADAPALVVTLLGRATVDLAAGRPEPARVRLERAKSILERQSLAEHPRMARVLRLLGDVHAARGAPTEALDAYERAVARYEAEHDPTHPELAEARFALARALFRGASEDAAGGARARVDALIGEAAQAYAALGPAFEAEAEAVAAWRRTLPPS